MKTRGRPFQKGNCGRPPGSRNKATLAAELILDGEAENLTRKAVERALKGDTQALRLCLDRLIAPRRERLVRFELPPIQNAADAALAAAELLAAASRAELSLEEAESALRVVEAYVKLLVTQDFEERQCDWRRQEPNEDGIATPPASGKEEARE
jgi:hypothetical protein